MRIDIHIPLDFRISIPMIDLQQSKMMVISH